MPHALPQDLVGLAWLALLFGLKHGLDADHLAAIDGLARFNSSERPKLARSVGGLFSLGHGVIVLSTALLVATLAQAWQVPVWLRTCGAWLSIGLLSWLALLNLATVVRTPAHRVAMPQGWRSGLFARLLTVRNPLMVMGVGAVFALSFDTLSLAALMAVAAQPLGGWGVALGLASLFVFGMLITDGLCGLWVARLMRRSDQTARVASRLMSLTVAGLSLTTAALGVAAQTSPSFGDWFANRQAGWSMLIMLMIGASLMLGRRLAKAAPASRPRGA